MKFTDLIAFARAGWKPADVREFLVETKDAAGNEEPAETAAEESAQPEPEKEATAAAPAAPPEDKEQKNNDLAGQVADLKKQLEKAQADLAKAQQANVRTDNSGGTTNKTPSNDALEDLVRSYM